jgi:hypothetical protein
MDQPPQGGGACGNRGAISKDLWSRCGVRLRALQRVQAQRQVRQDPRPRVSLSAASRSSDSALGTVSRRPDLLTRRAWLPDQPPIRMTGSWSCLSLNPACVMARSDPVTRRLYLQNRVGCTQGEGRTPAAVRGPGSRAPEPHLLLQLLVQQRAFRHFATLDVLPERNQQFS